MINTSACGFCVLSFSEDYIQYGTGMNAGMWIKSSNTSIYKTPYAECLKPFLASLTTSRKDIFKNSCAVRFKIYIAPSPANGNCPTDTNSYPDIVIASFSCPVQ